MQRFAPPILVLCLMAITIASVYGLNGFMWSHAGTAGTHMLTVARNSINTPLFFHASQIFANNTYDAYNHPAPLFFWAQALGTEFGTTFLSRLQIAYYLSAAISALSLAVLYAALRSFGIRSSVAALAVAAVCSTQLFITFRGFITYDVLSPLLSILFLVTITRLELAVTRRNILMFLATGILALMVSYYAVTIIAVYLGTRIILHFKHHGFKSAITSWPFICACTLAGFLVAEVSLLMLQEYFATGFLTSWQETLHRQSNLNTIAGGQWWQEAFNNLNLVFQHLPNAAPLAGILLLIKQAIPAIAKKKDLTQTTYSALINAALYVTVGATFFICITPGWSNVHPFAYFWYAPALAVIAAFIINAIPDPRLFALAAIGLIINAPVQLYQGYLRDLDLANTTNALLTVMDKYFPAGTTYNYGSKFENCGPFTQGHLLYIGSYPNRWLQPFNTTVVYPKVPYVNLTCGPGTLTFTPSNGMPGGPITINFPQDKY